MNVGSLNEARRPAKVHVIEAQHLFVPALVDVFEEAGFTVDSVASSIEPRRLLVEEPDIVFLDIDFLDEPIESVRIAHVLLPRAGIWVYASALGDAYAPALAAAGATIVLEKSAGRDDVVARLRRAAAEYR
jgi:DNA-binding NarL/FixJ family response regulator